MSKIVVTTHYDGNDLQQTEPIFELIPSLAVTFAHELLATYFTINSDCCNVG